MAVETLEGQTKPISPSKLLGRNVGGPYGGTSATGKLAGIVRGNKKAIRVNADKITRLKKISGLQTKRISGDDIGSKLPTEETAILDSLDNILELIRNEQKEEDRLLNAERKRRENQKRSKKESGLEKVGKSIKEKGKKVIDSIKSPFEKLIDALKTLLFGKIVIDLFSWFQNPDNNKKVQTIFRFLKDWWPTLLTGLILFGATLLGPTGLVIAGVALVVGFLPRIIDGIKQLFGFKKEIEADADGANKELAAQEKEVDKLEPETLEPETPETLKPAQQTGDKLASAPEPQTKEPPVQMKEGGNVPGSGPNKDTIPAMLAPGEFVMSKGAVNKFGSDTMASMNAMGGGTNRPMLVNNVVHASTGGQMGDKKEPGGRNKTSAPKSTPKMDTGGTKKPKNKRGSGVKNRTEGGGTQFFAGLGKGISDFFGGIGEGLAGAAGGGDKKGGGGSPDKFAKDMIKVHEGLRLDKYADSRGFPTIGYGHLIEEGETMPDRISQQKADELFDKDYEHHKAAAMKIPGYSKANEMQKAALIDLTFNMGPAWADGFPAFKKAFAAGNYEQAGNELIDSAYYGQVGRRGPTIVNLIKGKGADNVAYLKDIPKPAPGSSQPQMSASKTSTSQMSSPSAPPSISSASSSSSVPHMVASKPKPVVGQPVRRGSRTGSTVVKDLQKTQQAKTASSSADGPSIPNFSATAMRSGHKIKTLGIIA